jgi:hypothetical protein
MALILELCMEDEMNVLERFEREMFIQTRKKFALENRQKAGKFMDELSRAVKEARGAFKSLRRVPFEEAIFILYQNGLTLSVQKREDDASSNG